MPPHQFFTPAFFFFYNGKKALEWAPSSIPWVFVITTMPPSPPPPPPIDFKPIMPTFCYHVKAPQTKL
jgi:hypothetical protein